MIGGLVGRPSCYHGPVPRRLTRLLASLAVAAGCGGPTSTEQNLGGLDAGAPPFVCPGAGWITGTVVGEPSGVEIVVSLLRPEHPMPVGTFVPDAWGRFAFPGQVGSVYNLRPRYGTADPGHPGNWEFTFTPAQLTVAASSTCVENQDFQSQATQYFELSGTVALEGPVPLWSVDIIIDAANGGRVIGGTGSTVTLPGGGVQMNLPIDGTTQSAPFSVFGVAGTYTISAPAEIQRPALSGYSLKPLTRTIVLGGSLAPITGQDIVLSPDPHVISGSVSGYPANSSPYYYTAVLSDGRSADEFHGNFAFGAVANGTYTLSMMPRPEVTFTPASRVIQVIGGDVPDQDFVATLNTHTISGALADCGTNQVFVFMSADNWTTYTYNFQMPDAYQIDHVGDGTYTLTPSLSAFGITGTFDPPARVVNMASAPGTGQDFRCLP